MALDGSGLAHGEVETKVLSLKTGDEARDNNMHMMFNFKAAPAVIFDIEKADFSTAGGDVQMQGTLSMHGIDYPMKIMARVSKVAGGYVCQGTFPVSLRQFNLKPPSLLGIIRVADQVVVQFKVVFQL